MANHYKITMYLETGLEYRIHPIDISVDDQFKPEFLVFSSNNQMSAIIDTAAADCGDSIIVFELGVILLYLAEKTGQFLPKDLRGRKAAMECGREDSLSHCALRERNQSGFMAYWFAGWPSVISWLAMPIQC